MHSVLTPVPHSGRRTLNANYDLVIVGGGVGGAALAGSMASAGARVLVLEAEPRFRDRVRGEAIMPWGVAEVKLLGVEHTLIQAAANPLPFWDSYAGADRSGRRDLRRTTSVEEPALACYHPKLQESLLRWAEGCGAEVRRGVRVTGLDTSGSSPTLSAGTGGEISGRLIVGADGRGSTVRALAGFQTCQDAVQNLVSGVLMERVALAEDATHAWLDTSKGHFILHFPQGRERFRVYLCYPAASGRRFSGEADIQPCSTTAWLRECPGKPMPTPSPRVRWPRSTGVPPGRTRLTKTAWPSLATPPPTPTQLGVKACRWHCATPGC